MVATEKPRFGEVDAIFAIGLFISWYVYLSAMIFHLWIRSPAVHYIRNFTFIFIKYSLKYLIKIFHIIMYLQSDQLPVDLIKLSSRRAG